MAKIKSVTLLRDLPGVKAGTVAKENERYFYFVMADGKKWGAGTDYLEKYPDWFKVGYEEEGYSVNIFAQSMDTGDLIKEIEVVRLNKDTAVDLFNHLEKSKSEFFKGRCEKCGGKLVGCAHGKDPLCPYTPCVGCNLRNTHCPDCGEVAHDS
jgi:hypothetical protein